MEIIPAQICGDKATGILATVVPEELQHRHIVLHRVSLPVSAALQRAVSDLVTAVENDIVRQSMEDADVRDFMNKTIFDEVIPTLTLPEEELRAFAPHSPAFPIPPAP